MLLLFTIAHPLVDACSLSVLIAGGRGGPVGLFISTGALGLLAGRLGMERCAVVALPGFAAALAVVAAVAAVRWKENAVCLEDDPGHYGSPGRFASPSALPVLELAALIGLFLLVAWRSWAGLAAVRISAGRGMSLLLAGAAVTWCGKAVGGYLAERLGRWPVTAASVCGSGALAFLCPPDNAAAWMALLFVAQLATGPVLSLLYDRAGRRGGMAFGLNCLGLFAGSL